MPWHPAPANLRVWRPLITGILIHTHAAGHSFPGMNRGLCRGPVK